jgi:hypothetical protein
MRMRSVPPNQLTAHRGAQASQAANTLAMDSGQDPDSKLRHLPNEIYNELVGSFRGLDRHEMGRASLTGFQMMTFLVGSSGAGATLP